MCSNSKWSSLHFKNVLLLEKEKSAVITTAPLCRYCRQEKEWRKGYNRNLQKEKAAFSGWTASDYSLLLITEVLRVTRWKRSGLKQTDSFNAEHNQAARLPQNFLECCKWVQRGIRQTNETEVHYEWWKTKTQMWTLAQEESPYGTVCWKLHARFIVKEQSKLPQTNTLFKLAAIHEDNVWKCVIFSI